MPTPQEIAKHSDDAWEVIHVIYDESVNEFNKRKFGSVIYFLTMLDKDDVLIFAEKAYLKASGSSEYMSDSARFKYFCAICWNAIGEVRNA